MLIVIEGIDAAGKATQAKLLVERLGAELLAFPAYDTPSGRLIKAHLEDRWSAKYAIGLTMGELDARGLKEPLDATVFQSLMLTNRMEIAPLLRAMSLKSGVVLDRYWQSGYAYGLADGLDERWLLQIHEYLPQADLNILIDIDVEDSIKRRPARRDRYEAGGINLEAVQANYRRLWAKHPFGSLRSWRVVDGRRSQDEVSSDIWGSVQQREEVVHDKT